MKKLVMIMALLICGGAWADATNTWSAPISVTQTVAKIKLNNIQIAVMPYGKIQVIVVWTWLDSQNRAVRNGVTRYTEAEISAKLVAKGASIDEFKALFLAIAAEEAVAP